MPKPRIDKDCCVGCMNCTISCPRGVLIEPRIGMLPSIITEQECNGCKRCIDSCQYNAIKLVEE
jgi:Pyruvate/2-oxoacid:ferredoxin oxidoreductase delta subunit